MAKYYFGNKKAVVHSSNYLIAEVISSPNSYFAQVVFADIAATALPLCAQFFLRQVMIHSAEQTMEWRFAIEYRSKWMIDHSDIVVTCVHRSFGSTAEFKNWPGREI